MDTKGVITLLSLIVGQFALCSGNDPKYLVYFSKFLRPGFPIQFVAEILKNPNPVQLTATLDSPGKELSFKLETEISEGESRLLTFPGTIPMNYDGTSDFEMTIVGVDSVTNATIFTNTTSDLVYKRKAVSIFIQTDKGIYKRSQTIKFRGVVTTPDLLPYDGKVSYKVLDPDGNIVFQRKDAQLFRGVAGSEFKLNRYATFGDWKIAFTVNEYEKSVEVSVEEYKLPKFEVEVITAETYLHPGSQNLSGNISAKFTFGEPVKADYVKVLFELVPVWAYHYDSWYGSGKWTFEVEYPNFQGHRPFVFTMDELKKKLDMSFYGNNIVITASVRDRNSLVELSGSATVNLASEYNRLKVEEIFVPKTMKPGLHYTAYMKISQFDGQTISKEDRTSIGLSLEVQTTIGKYPNSKSTTETEELTIATDGMIVYSMDVSKDDFDSVSFSVRSKSSYVLHNWSAKKFHSPSGMYLQIKMDDTNLKPGETASLNVATTARDKVYSVVILGRGKIVWQEMYTPDDYVEENSIFKFVYTFNVTKEMAPGIDIMVFFMGTKGDIVSDSVSLLVDYSFENKVNVKTSVQRTETGKPVTLTVEASPDSLVALRAIDKSVILKKEGNDITSENIIKDLDEYSTEKPRQRTWWFWYPISVKGSNSREVFKESGLIAFTDAEAFMNQSVSPDYDYGDYILEDNIMFAMEADVAVQAGDSSSKVEQQAAPVVQTRKNFPETWIWEEHEVGSNGSRKFSFVLPDTSTTWDISAFAVSERTGLGVAEMDPQIIATRDFFISLDLPVSMVSGEMLVMRATVYNFFDGDLDVTLTLEENDWYEVVLTGNDTSKSGYVREIEVPPKSGVTQSFNLRFLKPGNAVIMMNAISEIAGDRIERSVLVKPEGIQNDVSQNVLIERNSREDEASVEEFQVNIPDDVVDSSIYGKISVSGNVMGNSLSNLGNLLKMPYGCGEQNMLNFAPDVYISLYLQKIDRLEGEVAEKSRRHIQKGYSGELRYLREDGSFSAFGSSDSKGSTWLTAFVVKCFISASELQEDLVDMKVVDQAINFLLTKQQNGVFREEGVVRHSDMQGGVTSRKNLTMTAYVLVAISEGGYNLKRKGLLRAINDGKDYLESHIANIEDTFALAITTYALALAESDFAASQMAKLKSRAKAFGNLRYWTADEGEAECDLSIWDYHCKKASSSDIEITAYALLTMVRLGQTNEALPIVRWLVKQRGSYGGYRSTQDTVMAIQALSVYAGEVSDTVMDMTLSVKHSADPEFSADFSVTEDNSIVLQSSELPSIPGNITVSASGIGVADVQVSYLYNIPVKDRSDEPFSVDITMDVSNGYDIVKAKICVSMNTNRKVVLERTGMFIVSLDLPSGYSANDASATNMNKNTKLVELDGTELTFYFDQLVKGDTLCFDFDLERFAKIGEVKPQSLRVADYYKPDFLSVRKFIIPGLADLDVCKVCGSDCYGCSGGGASGPSFTVLMFTLLCVIISSILSE